MNLLVFDSHPVQYRVPIWREMTRRQPGSTHVVYASDCSVRGHADEGFGRTFAWDDPMMDGYSHTILNCERGTPLSGWGSLTGRGVANLLDHHRPSAVLLTGLNYRYDLVAYREALRRRIPVWLRCETQDEAVPRSKGKSIARDLVYRAAYRRLHRVFYIGELNRRHYLGHGVPSANLRPARYGTTDRFQGLSEIEKKTNRQIIRDETSIPRENLVIGFSGKLIPKKNPGILFEMLNHLPSELREVTSLYFLGSGELEGQLRVMSDEAMTRFGVKTVFAGFVNQSQLASHYLAMDLMLLPSRRMGETWGLVANEAMQAGCGVVVSDAVGCGADFHTWERFRIFPEGEPGKLAERVVELARYPRSFDWASEGLAAYSIEASAAALCEELSALPRGTDDA